MSFHSPIQSAPLIAPESSAGPISPGGSSTALTPKCFSTAPPRPAMRNFSPFRSSRLSIGRVNHPPACTPDDPTQKQGEPWNNSAVPCCTASNASNAGTISPAS